MRKNGWYLLGLGILLCLFITFSIIGTSVAQDEEWEIEILATGQNQKLANIEIGINKYPSDKPNPPVYPSQTVILKIAGDLFKDIRQIGSDREVWTLVLYITDYADPNLEGYYPKFSWDPNKIGPADLMELRRGDTEGGELLVADMCTSNSYQTQEADGDCESGDACQMKYSIIFESAYHTYYSDEDNDGFGDPNIWKRSIDQPSGYIEQSGDCDDSDEAVNHGATEI